MSGVTVYDLALSVNGKVTSTNINCSTVGSFAYTCSRVTADCTALNSCCSAFAGNTDHAAIPGDIEVCHSAARHDKATALHVNTAATTCLRFRFMACNTTTSYLCTTIIYIDRSTKTIDQLTIKGCLNTGNSTSTHGKATAADSNRTTIGSIDIGNFTTANYCRSIGFTNLFHADRAAHGACVTISHGTSDHFEVTATNIDCSTFLGFGHRTAACHGATHFCCTSHDANRTTIFRREEAANYTAGHSKVIHSLFGIGHIDIDCTAVGSTNTADCTVGNSCCAALDTNSTTVFCCGGIFDLSPSHFKCATGHIESSAIGGLYILNCSTRKNRHTIFYIDCTTVFFQKGISIVSSFITCKFNIPIRVFCTVENSGVVDSATYHIKGAVRCSTTCHNDLSLHSTIANGHSRGANMVCHFGRNGFTTADRAGVDSTTTDCQCTVTTIAICAACATSNGSTGFDSLPPNRACQACHINGSTCNVNYRSTTVCIRRTTTANGCTANTTCKNVSAMDFNSTGVTG